MFLVALSLCTSSESSLGIFAELTAVKFKLRPGVMLQEFDYPSKMISGIPVSFIPSVPGCYRCRMETCLDFESVGILVVEPGPG